VNRIISSQLLRALISPNRVSYLQLIDYLLSWLLVI